MYYSVYSFGLTLGESGYLPPAFGLWLSNILFALAALLGLHMANRERFPSFAHVFGELKKKLRGLPINRAGEP
jgi:lipopolysaccharide export system permease protein